METVPGGARFKFSCCTPNRFIEDQDERGSNGLKSELLAEKGSHLTSSEPKVFYMENWLEKHKVMCRWDQHKEFLNYFQYRQEHFTKWNTDIRLRVKIKYYTGAGLSKMVSWCVRLDKKFNGGCVDMATNWSQEGITMASLSGIKVDCTNGFKFAGGNLEDQVGSAGKRRFLTQLKFERFGKRYRYVYKCCRIQP